MICAQRSIAWRESRRRAMAFFKARQFVDEQGPRSTLFVEDGQVPIDI
jgi:hypothetical protein